MQFCSDNDNKLCSTNTGWTVDTKKLSLVYKSLDASWCSKLTGLVGCCGLFYLESSKKIRNSGLLPYNTIVSFFWQG